MLAYSPLAVSSEDRVISVLCDPAASIALSVQINWKNVSMEAVHS